MPRTSIARCLGVTTPLFVLVLVLVLVLGLGLGLGCKSTTPEARAPAVAAPQSSRPPETPREAEPSRPADSSQPAGSNDGAVPPPSAPPAMTDAATCAPKPQPKGCPATEPNVNRPCSPKGMQCTYASGCCPPIYVCNKKGRFEARFTRC